MGLKEDRERAEKFAKKYKRTTHDEAQDFAPKLGFSIKPTQDQNDKVLEEARKYAENLLEKRIDEGAVNDETSKKYRFLLTEMRMDVDGYKHNAKEEDMQKIEDATLAAFKKDLSNKRSNNEGFEEVLEVIEKINSNIVNLPKNKRDDLFSFYKECKQDYKDTHILGVGKDSVYEKAKAVGGMARRFAEVCVSVLGTIVGVGAAVVVSPALIGGEKGEELLMKAATPAIHGSFARAEVAAKNNSTKRFTKEFGNRGGR
jgi:hypothetical protein